MSNPLDALKLTMTADITVGKAIENEISFVLENTGPDLLKGLVLSLKIPVGKASGRDTFLLRNVEDSITVLCTIDSDVPDRSQSSQLLWRTPSKGFALDVGATHTVTLKDFTPPGEGTAKFDLTVSMRAGGERVFPQRVDVKGAERVAILSFKSSSVNVRSGESITLSGYATNATSCRLFRDDQRLDVTLDPANIAYTDRVTASVTYRIEAIGEASSDERRIFINVESSGAWTSRLLLVADSGPPVDTAIWYPTLLLPAQDLRGGPGVRLYGIFHHLETGASRLYSSKSGVDGWRYEAEIPEGMEESPGVIHDGKLWLIGGSSWDPEKLKSNRVVCWYKSSNGSMEWKVLPGSFSARNCHACAVFEGRIWVLGGLNSADEPLNDTITTTSAQAGDEITLTWAAPKTAPWTSRCMFATVTSGAQFFEPRLWIYGGTPHPFMISPIDDLWYCTPNGDWTRMQKLPDAAARPLGATLLYDEPGKTLFLGGVFMGNEDKPALCHVSSVLPLAWASEPVAYQWRFGQQDMFLMRSVQFDRRRIFWPLYYRLDTMSADARKPRIYTL